jgi:hypothetical protein
MRPRFVWTLVLVMLFALAGCSISPSPAPTPVIPPVATITPPPTATAVDDATATLETTPIPVEPTSPPVEPTSPAVEPTRPPGDPFELISQESLFAFMEDLTAIQPYSGWRNSATKGESEALDYVAEVLEDLPFLQGLGLALERQSFRVFLATELWETRVHLTIDGRASEVPADGLRGPRDDIVQALRFDSDGVLNDSDPDPVVVAGPVVLVRSAEDIRTLSQADLRGKVVLLDYGVIDRALLGSSRATDRFEPDGQGTGWPGAGHQFLQSAARKPRQLCRGSECTDRGGDRASTTRSVRPSRRYGSGGNRGLARPGTGRGGSSHLGC